MLFIIYFYYYLLFIVYYYLYILLSLVVSDGFLPVDSSYRIFQSTETCSLLITRELPPPISFPQTGGPPLRAPEGAPEKAPKGGGLSRSPSPEAWRPSQQPRAPSAAEIAAHGKGEDTGAHEGPRVVIEGPREPPQGPPAPVEAPHQGTMAAISLMPRLRV